MQKVFDELSGDEEKRRKGNTIEAFETGQEGSFDVREKEEELAWSGLGKVQEKFGASWSLPLLQRLAPNIRNVGRFRSSGSFRLFPHGSCHPAPFYRF